MMRYEEQLEWLTCAESCGYFIDTYCHIYDATLRDWTPFKLWKSQVDTLDVIADSQLTIILKARQLGLTGLVLCYALWIMLFRPAATVLLFSRRDDESIHMLDFRLKGIYSRLPEWMRGTSPVTVSNDHQWMLNTGSVALAFPTTAGDSYTATLAVIDEADLIPDLNKLMGAVKPTIDGGGQMILLSRPNKSKPNSEFKKIYRAAKTGQSPWKPVFLPWHARPGRNLEWYKQQKQDIVARTGSTDDLSEQYPSDDTEALAPRTLDKRIASDWLSKCYDEKNPIGKLPTDAPSITGLNIYNLPDRTKSYTIGGDPAEGNPTSDDSALTVLCNENGEEVASLRGRFQPATFAAYIDIIGRLYYNASVMIERNNHGHAVLLWLRDNSILRRLPGLDGREGWHSTSYGKAMMYAETADAFRSGLVIVHNYLTYLQLASIDGSTLRAPEGELDDLADSFALAVVGRRYRGHAGI